jgi:hypothetical protein
MIVVISGVHSLFLFFLHLRLGQSCSAVLTIILENSVIILSRLAAAKRDNTYTRIMNLNERNDKQFFALVNRQRCVRTVNTPILKIDDKTFNNPVSTPFSFSFYIYV